MQEGIKKKLIDRMESAIEHFRRELGGIRTGRASTALLEGILVESYGSKVPLQQLATLSVPESRLIMIQPWDVSMVPAIEKAILGSGLGLTPAHDGKVLRINIPPLTEERRKEFVRLLKKMGEDARVVVRNHRRDANDELKKLEKSSGISKDDVRKSQEEIQKLTNAYIQKVDEIIGHKEEEILER